MRRSFQSKSFLISILFFATFVSTKANALRTYTRIDQDEEKTFEQTLIEKNVAFSKWFESMAEGLDLFLVDKQLQAEKNESSVRVENSTYSVEGGPLRNETVLAINPRLPNLEKYWNLKFTTYDEQEEGRGSDKSYLRQTPRPRNYGATVGLFSKFGKVRTLFQPRIELQDPLNVSQSLAFESVAEYKTFRINPKLEFFASATKGTGVFQAINFNFVLSPRYSLTLINEGTYEEKLNRLLVTNGISLGHGISATDALTYSFFVFATNRDNYHLDTYSLSASWFHVLVKKILDVQMTPHLDFGTARDFRGQLGVTLQVILTF